MRLPICYTVDAACSVGIGYTQDMSQRWSVAELLWENVVLWLIDAISWSETQTQESCHNRLFGWASNNKEELIRRVREVCDQSERVDRRPLFSRRLRVAYQDQSANYRVCCCCCWSALAQVVTYELRTVLHAQQVRSWQHLLWLCESCN